MLVGGVSLRRMMNFFRMDDRRELERLETSEAISLENCSFKWHRSIKSLTLNTMEEMDHHFELRNLTLHVKRGESVLIVGRTGSGKSSLMYSLLGELKSMSRNSQGISGSVSVAT